MAFSELVLMPVLNGTTGNKLLPFLPPPPPSSFNFFNCGLVTGFTKLFICSPLYQGLPCVATQYSRNQIQDRQWDFQGLNLSTSSSFFALMNPLLNYVRPSLSMGDHVTHDDMDHTYGNYKKIVIHHGHGQAYLIISQTQENGLINVEIKVQNLLLFSSHTFLGIVRQL